MIATIFTSTLLTKQGIHGLPKKPWNKVNFTQEKAGAKPPAGYCAHSMDKFPTWHRPYLALLEVSD